MHIWNSLIYAHLTSYTSSICGGIWGQPSCSARRYSPFREHLRDSRGIRRSRMRARARARALGRGAQFPGAGGGIPAFLPRDILIYIHSLVYPTWYRQESFLSSVVWSLGNIIWDDTEASYEMIWKHHTRQYRSIVQHDTEASYKIGMLRKQPAMPAPIHKRVLGTLFHIDAGIAGCSHNILNTR